MWRIGITSVFAVCFAGAALTADAIPAPEPATIDLTKWVAPDITRVGDDPFGQLVKYGYALFTETADQIGPTAPETARRFAGNNLACRNCHLNGGTQPYAMPMIGIWGQFPQYRAREGVVVTLEDRINGCMERSMNGHPLPRESHEMKALSAYMRWLSTGVPIGAKLLGAGTLRINEPTRAAERSHGALVYAQVCAACHGSDGLGQHLNDGRGYQFPPLGGPDSFNNGAGMSRLLTIAAYAMHNMPIGTTFNAPVLADEDAYDVAAYILSMKRPVMADLDKDFPIRLQKPVDTPNAPYADGFSLEQHTLGPFSPIRARLEELAAQSSVEKPGGPDNGSNEADRR